MASSFTFTTTWSAGYFEKTRIETRLLLRRGIWVHLLNTENPAPHVLGWDYPAKQAPFYREQAEKVFHGQHKSGAIQQFCNRPVCSGWD